MKASTERKIIRWLHIILSIPVVGYIYGPVASLYWPGMLVRWVMFPLIVLSGLWLWKGHLVKKWLRKKSMSVRHQALN
jgi:thiosulfate reductase cytochrome b subunit